jgi:hypothetical protein
MSIYILNFILNIIKKSLNKEIDFIMVRMTGIEPARRKALDPKSSASASSATSAYSNGVLYRIRTCDPLIKSQMLYQLS